MYKLLLVEDEEIIRKGIMAKIKYHNLGISEYYEAFDGLEALKMAQAVMPDIVVTDIHLLSMDGLTLIEQIHKNNNKVKFIIVSGYANFEYAKQAIKYGVVSYLLKPVGLDEMKEALTACIDQIEKQRYSDEEHKLLQTQYNKLECIQNINHLIYSEKNDDLSNHKEQTLKLFRKDTAFILASIMITQESLSSSNFKKDDSVLIRYAISNMAEEIEYNNDKVVFYNIKSQNQLYILFGAPNITLLKSSVEDYMNRLTSTVLNYLSVTVDVFISGIHEYITPLFVEELAEVISAKQVNSGDCHIFYFRSEIEKPKINLEDIKHLKNCIVNHYTSQIKDALKNFYVHEKNSPQKSTVAYYSLLFHEVAKMLESIKIQLNITKPIEEELKKTAENIAELFSNEKSVQEYLYNYIIGVFDAERYDVENIRNVDRIKLVQQYIETHSEESIGANELAEQFELSPNYLCTLFKKEVGQTIINYLNSVRIKKACNLLKTTSISANDISKMIGYENANYFYKTFKKYIGVTPVEYRNKNSI